LSNIFFLYICLQTPIREEQNWILKKSGARILQRREKNSCCLLIEVLMSSAIYLYFILRGAARRSVLCEVCVRQTQEIMSYQGKVSVGPLVHSSLGKRERESARAEEKSSTALFIFVIATASVH